MWHKVTPVSIIFILLLSLSISGCTGSGTTDDIKLVKLTQQQAGKLSLEIVDLISSCSQIDSHYEIVAVNNYPYRFDTSKTKGVMCFTNSTIKYYGSNHTLDTIIFLPDDGTSAIAAYAVLDTNYDIITGKKI